MEIHGTYDEKFAEVVEQFGVAFEFVGKLSGLLSRLLFQKTVFTDFGSFQIIEFFVEYDA